MRELWLGPAGTGKTRGVLEVIKEYLARGRGRQLLVLLPTASLVSHFQALLLKEKNLPGFVDQFLFTFHSLSYYLTAPQRNFTLARPHQKILLLEEVLKQNCPPYFEGVKDYPGFRQSLLKSFRELKERKLEPAFFEHQALAFQRQWSGKSLYRFLALAEIYKNYRRALEEKGWWDAEDLQTAAAALIQEDPGLVKGKELLILDGFYSFTPPEKALLEILLKQIPQAMLALTAGSQPSALFEPVQQTLKVLAPHNLEQRSLVEPHRFQSLALKTIAKVFLQNNSDFPAEESHQGLKVWAAPDRQAEVEAIAQEILFLVYQEGYAFADIGIILRQPRPYLELFQENLSLLNIPWRYWGQEPLSRHPWAKTALELGHLFGLGWERERVLRLLKSGYFNLELSWVDELEKAAQELSLSDEKQWRKFLTSGRSSARGKLAPEILNLLHRLGDCSAQFQGKASAASWAQKYRRLLAEFLLEGAVRWAPRQQRSLPLLGVETFLATVEEAGEFRDRQKIPFGEFHRALSLAVKAREVFATDLRREAVNLIGVHEARQWELPVVFVAGLVEGEFPESGKEDLFIKDYQRKALQAKGAANLPLTSAAGEEELLFYFAATRAQQRLYLTYPTGGASRQEILPSTFIEEVKALFSALAWQEIFAALSSPWEPPGREKVHSPGALSLFTLGRKEEDNEAGQAARWLLAHDRQYPWARMQALPAYQDFLRVPLENPAAKVYSISELETFAQCPLAYFYQHILGLEPLALAYTEDQEPPFWGTLAHQILEGCYRRGLAGKTLPASEDFFSAFAEVLAKYREQIPANYHSFREQEFLRRNLTAFLEREGARSHLYPFRPQALEWSFGKGAEPLMIATQEGSPISLSGKIDRLDISEGDKIHALVIDYKYSRQKKPLRERVESGQELQIPLYLLAAQELLGYKPVGGLLYYLKIMEKAEAFEDLAGIGREGLWPQGLGGKKISLYNQEEWQAMMQGIKVRVGELTALLRQGYIKATPGIADYCSPRKCQFYDLCPTRERAEKQG